MNLSELQSVQARERQSDELQELRPSFYRDAAQFVAELRDERARVAADAADPFEDPEVTRLTDDIRTAERTIEAIYDRRIGKVVKVASLAAADMQAEATGLTTEERELFETLVAAIESHRDEVLARITDEPADAEADSPITDRTDAAGPSREEDGGREPPENDVAPDEPDSATAGDPVPAGDPPVDGGAELAEGEGGGESASAAGGDRTTVRITEDVGAILGVDEREYDLGQDDVVSLPTENAAPLIERDAAEPIE